jgi:ethanolamine utilization protein EutQ (cupin superfamily)
MDPHAIAVGAVLHILEGRLRIHLADAAGEATAGDVVVLNQNLREPVAALEDAAVLAMVAWADGPGTWDWKLLTADSNAQISHMNSRTAAAQVEQT